MTTLGMLESAASDQKDPPLHPALRARMERDFLPRWEGHWGGKFVLHGSQPDVVVVCHEPGRQRVLGHPDYAVPSIEDTIDLALLLGARTRPGIRCGGVALNTGRLEPAHAARLIASESERLGCAVADPMRGGAAFERLVEACLA